MKQLIARTCKGYLTLAGVIKLLKSLNLQTFIGSDIVQTTLLAEHVDTKNHITTCPSTKDK